MGEHHPNCAVWSSCVSFCSCGADPEHDIYWYWAFNGWGMPPLPAPPETGGREAEKPATCATTGVPTQFCTCVKCMKGRE